MKALGRRASLVPGAKNKVMTFASRLLPRGTIARLARAYSDLDARVGWVSAQPPKTNGASRAALTARSVGLPGTTHGATDAPDAGDAPAVRAATGRFQRELAVLLMTFGAVALVDLVVVSLLTGRLRVWFPVWLDPQWDSRPDPWVVYSQSYIAGIALIPVLLRLLDRELLRGRGAASRVTFYIAGLSVFGLVAWWKGDLMARYGKEREALAWVALTALLYGLLRVALALPGWVARLERRELLRGLVTALAAFFLVMAVVDPVVQVGVHGLPWSPGLLVEIGFFVPAGVGMLWARGRLRASGAR